MLKRLSNQLKAEVINVILIFSRKYKVIGNFMRKFKIYRLANKKIHQINSIQFYSQFIKEGDLIFDIGANYGQKTRLFLTLDAKVVSVEPVKKCFERLNEVFGNNENVILLNEALGNSEGDGNIYVCNELSMLSTLSEKWKEESRFSNSFHWAEREKIKITTLDTLIQRYGVPDFCKIDVEGYELNVIKGLSQKIPIINFEFTNLFYNEALESISHLLSIGTAMFNLVLGETLNFFFSHWITSNELLEFLEKKREQIVQAEIFVKYI